MRAATVVEQIVNTQGVIARRDHPDLSAALDYMLRLGVLRAVLPGIYARAGAAEDFTTRVAAVAAYDPDAVIVGSAAARLTFWPKLTDSTVAAAARRHRYRRGPVTLNRRMISPELITERRGVRMTTPALTALDLATTSDGGSIDRVLRTRQASLTQMRDAIELSRHRAGNTDRRQLLLDSRDEPWSKPERQAHALLREAGIEGWQANYRLELLTACYFLDIAFEKQRLAIEIDGREYHGPEQFEEDRWRQNAIIFDGWHLLRFAANVLDDKPRSFVAQVRQGLARWAA